MNIEMLEAKVTELKELKHMKSELEGMISAIEDEIKAEMTRQDVEELSTSLFKITWKPVVSNRFDTTAFKKAQPDVASQFMVASVSRRFTVS